jgi:hypothetical protein
MEELTSGGKDDGSDSAVGGTGGAGIYFENINIFQKSIPTPR